MSALKELIALIASGATLDEAQAARAFDIMMSGEASEAEIGGFLMGLRVRGETVDEITGAARTMRARATPVAAPEGAIDIVGTGGDAKGTYNISTCTALVVAGAGVPVAKHGNRSVSSRSGAADVLQALGVALDIGPDRVAACIREAGVGFMFAPAHHAAMKHVMPARLALGTRTIFNLLGPLTNPAGVRRQVLGVFSRDWVAPLAEVMGKLGAERVWVVHGADGMDELTTTSETHVAEWRDGQVATFTVAPEDAGLARAAPEDLVGGDAEANAEAIRAVLAGEAGPFRDVVVLNAAAALVVAGRAEAIAEGAREAEAAIDEGRAQAALDALVAVSNG